MRGFSVKINNIFYDNKEMIRIMNILKTQGQSVSCSILNGTSNANEEVEVEIASAWLRIGAYIINVLFSFAALSPLGIGVLVLLVNYSKQTSKLDPLQLITTPWIIAGVSVYIAYCIWQCVWMSKYGQSIGKRLLKIRVLRLDGTNPVFMGTVLLREALFNLLTGVGAGILALLAGVLADVNNEILSNLFSLVVWLVCLAMLFQKQRDRRTLQDILAATVVVRLP